jgi:hypothetical protein
MGTAPELAGGQLSSIHFLEPGGEHDPTAAQNGHQERGNRHLPLRGGRSTEQVSTGWETAGGLPKKRMPRATPGIG